MAIDSAAKRATAATVGPPINAPSVIPNAVITSFDRYQIGWSYRIASSGTLMFYGTTLESGVDSASYAGVTMDDSGNLRASGAVYEGP
jgi:hypothetical protein